jgi:hypothetical protein
MGTWTCQKCHGSCAASGSDRGADCPAGLSEEERAGFDALVAAQGACGEEPGSLEEFESDADARKIAVTLARAARAPLEAENKTLRERVREFEERYAAASQESIMFRGDANKAAKESEMFRRMHLQICEVAQERAEKIKALEAQLAQAQKPAAKSLADMIAESTTLAMGQRTAALETMIREFLKQTGANVEDCVLVEQMEDTKLTWHIEHRPKGEGGET